MGNVKSNIKWLVVFFAITSLFNVVIICLGLKRINRQIDDIPIAVEMNEDIARNRAIQSRIDSDTHAVITEGTDSNKDYQQERESLLSIRRLLIVCLLITALEIVLSLLVIFKEIFFYHYILIFLIEILINIIISLVIRLFAYRL